MFWKRFREDRSMESVPLMASAPASGPIDWNDRVCCFGVRTCVMLVATTQFVCVCADLAAEIGQHLRKKTMFPNASITFNGSLTVAVVTLFLQIFVLIFLAHGVLRRKPMLLIPWLIVQAMTTIKSCVLVIAFVISAVDSSKSIKRHSEWKVQAIYAVAFTILSIVDILLFCAMIVCLKRMKNKYAKCDSFITGSTTSGTTFEYP